MRYIRTKNNQIVDLDTMEFDWAFPRENFVKAHAVKQADTIEELCDEFVVLNPCENNRPMLMTGLFVDINRNLLLIRYVGEDKLNYEDYCFPDELPLDKADVYGAIWTDKGLIYVAKMNEKGELELL